MIVSHRHRFIFLKTRKTAGTSIEVALSQLAGEDAIVTPVHPAEPGHTPRNYESVADAEGEPFLPHMRSQSLRSRLGQEVWNGYFKFCFERNPWDKVVSIYRWRNRRLADPPPFDAWLFSDPRVFSDWPIYSIDGECAVDAVGRYETLTADLDAFLERVGIVPGDLTLPHAKGGLRRGDVLYSPPAAAHVRQVFSREVEMFGYDCPAALLA